MTTQSEQQQPTSKESATTETGKKHKARSPSYPAIDLETAIARARELHNREGMNSASISVILKHWGYDVKSSGGLVALAALIKFGLLADEGSGDKRKARLTELARRIILDERATSPERDTLIKEAALTPAIHQDLWTQYKGHLPSDENLRHELRVEKAFTDYGAKEFIEEFKSTVAFAKLAESDMISPKVEDKEQPEEEITMTTATLESSQAQQKGEGQKQATTTLKQIQIPYALNNWAKLEAGFPMSEDDWNQMMAVLTAMKPALVLIKEKLSVATQPATQKPSLSTEARELLLKVDSGGVAMNMTPNLERIAKEYGIAVNPNTTPNEVIDRLRKIPK